MSDKIIRWIETHQILKEHPPEKINKLVLWPQVYETELPNTIKVIEFSAYQQTLDKIKELEMANSEREKQNEELIVALEFYRDNWHGYSEKYLSANDELNADMGSIARQALAKVKGEKNV